MDHPDAASKGQHSLCGISIKLRPMEEPMGAPTRSEAITSFSVCLFTVKISSQTF